MTASRFIVAIGLLLALHPCARAADILFTLAPETEGIRFGSQVAPLGDVDGDGFADILVLAPDAVGTGYRGKAYIYFGGPGADAAPDLVLQGLPGVGLEQTLAGPFDFNADGHDDIALAAAGYDDGDHTDAGAVFVYYGGPGLDAVPDLTLVGDWTRRRFGTAIACAGEFNPDDSYDDLAVTIETDFGFGPFPTVYVFFGGPQPANVDGWRRVYQDYYAYWGHHLAYAGDFDGDGFGDLLGTAPAGEGVCVDPLNLNCPGVGHVLVYRGGADMWHAEMTLWGDQPYAHLGADADGAFDIDGDGFDDLIAAAPGSHRADLIFGQSSWPSSFTARRLEISPAFDVAGLGDVNGDGFADVAVADSTNLVVVYHGGATVDTAPDVALAPEAGEQWDAVQVTRAGDFDGDGLADLAVHFRQGTSLTTRLDRVRIYGHLIKTQVPVYLASFRAVRQDAEVVVSWSITGPTTGAVFRVWRESPPARRVCLSTAPISGSESFEFIDRAPGAGPADYWLQEITTDGSDNWYGPAHLLAANLPAAMRLYPVAPNPFNPRTTIRFDLPAAGHARLAIYDVAGRLVRVLVEGELPVGTHEVVWDGRDAAGRALASGSYFARLEAGGKQETTGMILVR